jgi:hypothetical protein
VLAETDNAYSRVQRVPVTAAARQVRRLNASTGQWENPFFE